MSTRNISQASENKASLLMSSSRCCEIPLVFLLPLLQTFLMTPESSANKTGEEIKVHAYHLLQRTETSLEADSPWGRGSEVLFLSED